MLTRRLTIWTGDGIGISGLYPRSGGRAIVVSHASVPRAVYDMGPASASVRRRRKSIAYLLVSKPEISSGLMMRPSVARNLKPRCC